MSLKDQICFLDIAKGSAAEFATQTYIAMDIGYVEKALGRCMRGILRVLVKIDRATEMFVFDIYILLWKRWRD